jgi:hypothetical protein
MRLFEFTETFDKKKLNEAGPAVVAVPVGIGAMEALAVALGFAGAAALTVDIQQNPNKYNATMRAAATAYTTTMDYFKGDDAVESVPANVASGLENAATRAILSQPAEIQSLVSSQTQEIINRVDRDADAMASGEMSASDIVARMSAEIRANAAASRAARAAGAAIPAEINRRMGTFDTDGTVTGPGQDARPGARPAPVAFASDPDVPVFAPEPAAAPTDEPAAQPAPEPTTTDDEITALPVPATAPTAISVDTPIRPTPMPPPVITPLDEPVDEPVTRPAPVELPQPDTDTPPQVDTTTPKPAAEPTVEPDTPVRPAPPEVIPSERPARVADRPIIRQPPIALPQPEIDAITDVLPNIDVVAPAIAATGAKAAAAATTTRGGRPTPPRKKRYGGDVSGGKFGPMKFTPIQIADPLRLRRYQEFK